MQNLSLYDILVGKFNSDDNEYPEPDHFIFDQYSEEVKLRSSIIENLKMILNTRQGSILHLPDFGMPDVLQVYFKSGCSIEPIIDQIKHTILKYEPRIGNALIEKSDFDQNNMRISLKINASIKDTLNKEILLTEFSSTGWSKVVFEKDINDN